MDATSCKLTFASTPRAIPAGALEAVAGAWGAAGDITGGVIVATGTTGGCHGFDPNDGC
jgi:hypothetical protein